MRERLISVAIQQFGEHGFAGASTRDIAAAADTTMSNITYHFGGKDGLITAIAEHRSAALNARRQEVLDDILRRMDRTRTKAYYVSRDLVR